MTKRKLSIYQNNEKEELPSAFHRQAKQMSSAFF
jgi:hypothetical protein